MPANLDYELYFNIAFFAVIGIGFLIGLIRGLKKSLYALVVTALFYGLFFVTIDTVVNQLWELPLPFLFSQLGGVDPALVNAQTLGEAFSILLESYLGEMVGDMLTNEEFLAFVTGVALFAVKLVYTLLYFTVFQLIYRFVFFIIRLMFFGKTQAEEDYKLAKRQIRKMKLKGRELRRMKKGVKKDFKQMSRKERRMQIKQDKKLNKKRARRKEFKRLKKETKLAIKQMSRKERRRQSKEEKLRQKFILKNGYYFNERQLIKHMQKPSKLPLMGAVAGAAKGALSAFVTLIILGGMINIMESFISVIPQDQPTVSREYIEHVYLANGPVDTEPQLQPMASPFAIPAEVEEQLDLANELITAFNNNVFVSNASSITYGDENYAEEIPLHLYLFDSVLSFNYREEKIMFRQELDTFSDTAGVLLNSDYVDSNDLSDITSEEIIELFDTLSNSRLVTSLLPLGIEVGSEVLEVDVAIPTEELYDIDWQSELQTLGSVAAVGFEIVNTAGLLAEDPDMTTITLDGDEVEGLFDSLADSELATLGAYVALEPLLENAGGQLQAIITVPAGLDWANEFRAFGDVANAVLSTGITMEQLSDGDPTEIISALSTLDFTVLLNSDIVTQAMINIFSGEAGIEGLDMIIVPDGIEWLDLEDGGDVIRGELYNILSAVNAITSVFDDFSFENIDITFLSNLENDTIDTIFESDVLVATISNFVTEELDLGDTPLVIPDSVFDLNGYITNVEMKAVVSSVKTLIDNLPCDVGDTACEEIGFDFEGALTLETSAITTVVQSDIIGATVGNLIVDQAGTILTIPVSAMMSVNVDEVPTDIISKQEIIDMFSAIAVLEFDDLETMEFDATIIDNLAIPEDSTELDPLKTDQLFGSKIVHATISHMLIDLEDTDGILVVPKFAADDTTEIRQYDATDDLDYVSKQELDDILQALLKLSITDFTAIDSLDLNDIIDNQTEILASSILQATVTKQVLDLGSEVVTVPYADQDGNDVRVVVGDALAGTDTEYIVTDEISAILDALVVLDATDIQNFSGDVDIQSIASDSTKVDTLLSSATIHATMTTQLLNLEDTGVLAVPYLNETETVNIRVSTGPVGNETEFIIKDEIQAMLDVLNLLGITDNLDEFSGNVNIGAVLSEVGGVDTLLSSATIHATISKQLFDLEDGGTLAVPYFNESGTAVRVTVGDSNAGTDTDYMTEAEVRAMLDVLELLGIADDLENFNGSVNLGQVLGDPAGVDTLMSSATIHATISKQLFDLEDGGTLAVPYFTENGDAVRVSVGDTNAGTETNYMTEVEVRAMLDVLDLLGIADDLENFDGNVNLATVLEDPSNYDTLLASATIHATISKQLIDLDVAGSLVVPFLEEDNATELRVTVGSNEQATEYITEVEVRALLDALNVLEIASNINEFNGAVNIQKASQNVTVLLASSTIQATISKQMIDLDVTGTLIVPFLEEDNATEVRRTVGTVGVNDTEYIIASEIEDLFTALDTLGLTNDIENFDGNINLSVLDEELNPGTPDDAKVTNVVSSAILQATISKQIIDIESSATVAFLVPHFNDDETQPIRISVGDTGDSTDTNYVWSQEIKNIIKGMRILGISDVTTFNGDIALDNFFEETPRNDLLSSSIMQATISKQLIDLGAGVLLIPEQDINGTDIRLEVGDSLQSNDTEYVSKDEIAAMFEALEVLGLTNVNDFAGSIDLTNVYGTANQDVILASAAMHATISDQMLNLGTAALDIPDNDVNSVVLRASVGPTAPEETTFIIKDEIKALINALEVLNITDIENFNGSFNFGVLSTETNQDILLSSASLHKTITNKLSELDDSILIIPTFKEDTTTPVLLNAVSTEFVAKFEIKALIDAFTAMGYSNLDSFGASLNSSEFFSNRATLLASSSIQATLSDKLLNGTNGFLLIPDAVFGGGSDIRIPVGSVTYVESGEIDALMAGLEEMGLTDFSTIGGSSFGASSVLASDFSIVLQSRSLQVTISDNILSLATTLDENDPYTMGRLVVPTMYRQTINVASSPEVQILNEELLELLEGMGELGFSDFGASIGGSAITAMNDTTLDEMFDSGSIHLTLDSMVRANSNISVPVDAEDDVVTFTVNLVDYTLSDVTTEAEIRNFLGAVTAFGAGDFSSVSFNLSGILNLSAQNKDDIATSMIARYTLHSEVYGLTQLTFPAAGTPFRALVAGDFMSGNLEVDANTSFFIKDTFLEAVNHDYNLLGS